LGALDTGFAAFGEVTDRKTRAELLDEGLEIITGLWGGQPFRYEGKHYQVKETEFQLPPPPVQQPRIPIWVVGAWLRPKSMQRALRYDGLLPAIMDEDGKVRMAPPTPAEIQTIKAFVDAHRVETTAYDIVVEGESPGDDRSQAMSVIQPYAEAGATWWIEARWTASNLEGVLERIRQGPPPETA
jgi:hypothetical protein